MKTASITAMLDRIASTDDVDRLDHYASPASVQEWCPAGAGHLGWVISVRGYAGGYFAVATPSPRGWTESDARGWAHEIRRRASARLAAIEASEMAAC